MVGQQPNRLASFTTCHYKLGQDEGIKACFALWLRGTSPVRLRDIIRAAKTGIKVSSWSAGKVPKADFPIAKKAYGLGNAFKWCVIRFQALDTECRVLVVLNESKQKYEAVLGVMGVDGTLRILCSYEYHETEPGWHCHATHDDVSTLSHGFMRGPWIKRVPGAQKEHRFGKHPRFSIGDETKAVHFAVDRYRIVEKGPLLGRRSFAERFATRLLSGASLWASRSARHSVAAMVMQSDFMLFAIR
jgi:hypothetical protein